MRTLKPYALSWSRCRLLRVLLHSSYLTQTTQTRVNRRSPGAQRAASPSSAVWQRGGTRDCAQRVWPHRTHHPRKQGGSDCFDTRLRESILPFSVTAMGEGVLGRTKRREKSTTGGEPRATQDGNTRATSSHIPQTTYPRKQHFARLVLWEVREYIRTLCGCAAVTSYTTAS